MADPRTCTNIQTVENPTHGGTWTRSDGSIGQDEQRWEHFYGDDMLIVFAGKRMFVERTKPDGTKILYHGVISDTGSTVQGILVAADLGGNFTWSGSLNYS